jgi:hypothetical protein
VLVVVRRLLRVPDPELDVIPAVERHEVFGHDTSLGLRGLIWDWAPVGMDQTKQVVRSGAQHIAVSTFNPDPDEMRSV